MMNTICFMGIIRLSKSKEITKIICSKIWEGISLFLLSKIVLRRIKSLNWLLNFISSNKKIKCSETMSKDKVLITLNLIIIWRIFNNSQGTEYSHQIYKESMKGHMRDRIKDNLRQEINVRFIKIKVSS